MRFENHPQLLISKDEFETLDKALKLCRDMDEKTGEPETACMMCPFQDDCSQMCLDCVYARAHKALKKIIDVAIVK